jgi:hypothetical protein
MQAGIWGMDFYANYLRGKRFFLYTDHKPLENLGHLHKKTLNRLQIAMNEFDFEIRYKKGINMPADYLSRYTIAALNKFTPQVDPFTPDLQALQAKDPDLIKIQYFFSNGKWPLNTTKAEIRRLLPITTNFVKEKNTIWVRLNDHDYPRVALFLPQVFRKKAICQAHGSLLSGHDALNKTYIRLTSSFFWPTVKTDIQKHIDSCLQCQQQKKSTAKPLPLQTLPTVDLPNYRIHIDLFGPLKTSSQGNKMILCITDTFTKYAEVIAIPDKHAETVANELMIHWIADMAHQSKFTLTMEKNLLINCPKNFFSCRELNTLLQHQHTLNATCKWRSSTKQWQNTWHHSWTTLHWIGNSTFLH